ncbi:MAG: AAA family ATPase, partial [Nitrospirota bacterium]|nr:AAA family ATPase [Nitrospirota bacterium]
MRISSFRVSNYKSFLDSSELVLTDGFNVIIGQNNVGKTALLEAISLTFSNKAHKSLLSLPLETSITDPISVAQVAFTVTGEEVREILLAKSDDFHVPIPADTQHPNPNQAVEVLESILKTPQIEFLFAFNGYSQWSSIRVPTFGLFRSQYDSQ